MALLHNMTKNQHYGSVRILFKYLKPILSGVLSIKQFVAADLRFYAVIWYYLLSSGTSNVN